MSRVIATMWTSVADLAASWTVLETEAAGDGPETLRAVSTGIAVSAGPIDAGVDAAGHRHLLIPLLDGEAVAEDRGGRGVQIWRVDLGGRLFVSLVCLVPALNDVFERLASEVLAEVQAAPSPARRAAEVLHDWKELLAAAASGPLSDERLVGLLAELLCFEEVVRLDPLRRVDTWNGPSRDQHDLRYGDFAVEVKATTAREGRVVSISSVDQLDPTPASTLHIAFHRFQAATTGAGESLPGVVGRLLALGVNSTDLYKRLALVGYSTVDEDNYRSRLFRLTERRIYDTSQQHFPAIVRDSFKAGDLPPGTLRLSYAIDLTNEPPAPMTADQEAQLWRALAGEHP